MSVRRAVQISNPLGMHARAAARFARLASGFEARVAVEREWRSVDGKSILGLLLLAAAQGTTITLVAEGPDAAEAVDALAAFVESGFEEPGPAL
jgi:phosphocarrier protein